MSTEAHRIEFEELESPEVVRELAASILATIKVAHPCTRASLLTALMLAARAELDAGGMNRSFGHWIFGELLKIDAPSQAPEGPTPQGETQ